VAVQVIAGRMIDHYVVEFPGESEVLCARGIGIEMNKESKTLSKNPVISADLLDSCHSFIRAIRDKISTKRSRMATNDANYTNLVAIKSECFHWSFRLFRKVIYYT